MYLILGGAYQGKTEYAMSVHGLSPADMFVCEGTEIPQSVRALCHAERFALACAERGMDAVSLWEELQPAPELVICDDIFCGVVPMDPMQRRWREETGKLLQLLAGRAEKVTRVFCGLPLELKP